MKKAIVTSLFALLFCTLGAFGQKEFAADYDAFVRRTLERFPEIPAVGIVVIKGDKPVFVRAYGIADKETRTKADADTLFYIASSTKSYMALAAALIDKEGKIKLADPIAKYANGISLREPLPDKVTIRDLLTHTSGLRNSPLGFRMAYTGESDPKDMKAVFAGSTTFNEPGFGKYAYTNLGYNIYAVLLDNHLQLKWQDVLQKKVFDPLKLDHTTAYISGAGTKKWTVAAPYIFSPGAGKTVRSPLAKTDNNMQSAGGMFTSINDIGRWLNMNMNGGRLDGKQAIPADVIRAAHTGYTQTTREGFPFTGDGEYGLGWQIGKFKNEKVIYHHGGFPGYNSHVSFMPERKIAVAVLTNDGSAGGRAGHLFAAFAYDWWLQSPTLKNDYAKLLQEFSDNYENGRKRAIADFAERAKRTSQLSGPLTDYAGTYRNEFFGTVTITVHDGSLAVKLGNLNAIATPYTEKESVRVEMIPGQGDVMRFLRNAEGQVVSLTTAGAGVPFARVAQ